MIYVEQDVRLANTSQTWTILAGVPVSEEIFNFENQFKRKRFEGTSETGSVLILVNRVFEETSKERL